MRRILWIIAAGVIVVALGWWVAQLPGRVTLAVGRYSIETSAPVAAVLGAVAVLVLAGLLRLLLLLAMLGPGWRRWRLRRRRAAGDIAVTRALVALAAAEPTGAKRESARARHLLGDTAQTLLLAAEANRLAGSEDGASAVYRQLAERDDAALLGLRGLFRQAIAREDWPEAALLARQAEIAHPGAAWLREARLNLAVRTADWKQALLLAGPGAPVAALTAAAAAAEPDPGEALRLARQAWKAEPGFAPAALGYARLLRRQGKESRAQSVLRGAWQAAPQPALAELALDDGTVGLARVKAATAFVEANPNHPESHLVLARVTLAAGLTGEARRHLERARAAGLNQRRVFLLLAELEEVDRGGTEAGQAAQRDALREAAAASPDPGWNCDKCGSALAAWQPACPACHTAGSIVWGVPHGPVVLARPLLEAR
jgi:HemY protein